MALTPITAERLVKIVCADSQARSRISSILAAVPFVNANAGGIRNYMLAFAQTYVGLGIRRSEGYFNVDLRGTNPFNPFLPNSLGHRLNCVGIAEAAVAAINQKINSIPEISLTKKASRSASWPHAGVSVFTRDQGHYIMDWWMNLDPANPMMFKFADWDRARTETGIPFHEFKGFA